MPVVSQTPYTSHLANGVSDTFGYEFQLIQGTDLEVKLDGVVQSSGYTVTGVGVQAGGDVVFDTPPANNTLVEFTRKIPRTRSTNYPYLGDLPEATVDADFDRLVQMIQDLAYFTDTLGLKLPAGDTRAPMVIPSVTDRASKFFAFNSDGDAIAALGVPDVPASAWAATLLEAVSAAAARTVMGAAASGAIGSSGLTMATSRLLGRTTASTGAPEEISVGDGLSLSGGVLALSQIQVAVRQTVLSGPVDSSGNPAFGGSTGTATVTASGTLVATAANGIANRTGSIANPSWTGLSTNGTMYLYLDIAADGTCTTGSTTLEPIYREGGADVTTNNQFTFNIGEMVGKVGNGSVANQVHRVFVGQVTVAGGVVTAIVWYALRGRYQSAEQAIPANSTLLSVNHNLGVRPQNYDVKMRCVITEHGYPVGAEATFTPNDDGDGGRNNGSYVTSMAYGWMNTSTSPSPFIKAMNAGGMAVATPANWRLVFQAQRGW